MLLSLNWIKKFVDFEVVDKKSLKNVVVGYVESIKKHPDADKLNVAQVNIGNEITQIVCGGGNLTEKTYVAVALPGAVLPGNFKIKPAKVRGEESNGMVCGIEELNLGMSENAHEIWILDSKKDWKAGTPLIEALGLNKGYSPEELSKLITIRTAEVEGIIPEGKHLHRVVTGKLLSFEKIEDTDNLHIGQFDIGHGKAQIVFGKVFEISPGEILPLALPGAILPGGEIKKGDFKGVKSEGMVCGDSELGIQNSEEGITRFPEGTPLGVSVADILEMNGFSLEIDNKSLTHRPDLWGHYGFAREFAAIFKTDLKPIDFEFEFPKEKSSLEIKIEDENACRTFTGCIVKGIKAEESPQWLKTLLQAAGVRPISNIVDITNYVMLELGQPMHAYDRKMIGEDFLEARFARKGEKMETIDHKVRELRKEDLVIANSKGPLGLAGVMGGVDTEINDDTTEIILEAANFDPVTVRKGSTYHGLRTDAIQRFEKSLDPLTAKQALIRACQLIKEICPDAVFEGDMVITGTPKIPEIEIKLDPEYVKSIIGKEIDGKEMIETLTRLGFEVQPDKILTVKVPSWRATKDVDIAEDLIEEIARMHGYENIEGRLPPLPIVPPRDFPERSLKHKARQILALGLNCSEVVKYSFYSKEDVKNCMLDESRHLRVDNYLSEDQTHMRTTLIPNMLKAAHLNLKYQDELKIFEFGRTYIENGYMPTEEKHLCAIFANATEQFKKNKKKGQQSCLLDESFYTAKGTLEAFFQQSGAEGYRFKKTDNPPAYAHPKKCLSIQYRGKTIGHVFTLHPIVLRNYDIEADTAAFELNFTQLIASGLNNITYKPLPKLPSLTFDISVVLNEKKEIADIEKIIKNEGGKLIKSIELFDIYQGENLGEGKKSLAFRITLHSDERTLTDEDMAGIQKKIFDKLITLGGEIRGI
ncbi:phenylalanine--tRNA ligase subunit beta [Candidatus Peregrinibacteria bacterium]|nr:phenylalanine--tRNA ligase subunit beta [Candidatus Peregrinibacteria bacterium]